MNERFYRGMICGLALGVWLSFAAPGRPQIPTGPVAPLWPLRFSPEGGHLSLQLAGVSQKANWAVGVRVGDAKAGELIVHGVELTRIRGPITLPIQGISQISAWPANKIEIESGRVKVSGLRGNSLGLMVFVDLPHGTELSVTVDSGVVYSGMPPGSLLLYNGDIIPRDVGGPQTPTLALAAGALLGGMEGGEIVSGEHGEMWVTMKGLISHMRLFVPPDFVAPEAERYPWKIAEAELTIDRLGSVTRVRVISGGPQPTDSCRRALARWKFRPFLLDGRAVAVRGIIAFSPRRDGTIWPAFGD